MEDDKLYEKNRAIDQDIYRNINSLEKSEDLFDDLYDDSKDIEKQKKIVQLAEARVKNDCPPNLISRGFHYTQAIASSFDRSSNFNTRYSNGSYACLYGAMSDETTIYETAYHALNNFYLNVDNPEEKEQISSERAIYKIYCKGILIDLVGKEDEFPFLVSNDYTTTQIMGQRIMSEGHPGLVAPSARTSNGECLAIFKKEILNNPRLMFFCKYVVEPKLRQIRVLRSNRLILQRTLEEFRSNVA